MIRRANRTGAPQVDQRAAVAPTAVLVGAVTIGAGVAVLDGAVITAESAPVHVEAETVIMEHSVIRGAGKHETWIGRRTMIGPGTHISGAVIGDECMIATHSSVFNGATIESGVLVAIGAIVHVGTRLRTGDRVPMHHIAVGDPAVIYSPDQSLAAHRAVEELGFTRLVFDHDTSGTGFRETMAWMNATYSAALVRGAGSA